MTKLRVLDDSMFELLRMGETEAFNKKRDISVEYDLSGTDLSRIDLRGIDFRKAKMEGASFAGAKISGCYFPIELRADEILFSLEHGTRVRYSRPGAF